MAIYQSRIVQPRFRKESEQLKGCYHDALLEELFLSNVASIGSNAFDGCSSLTGELHLPDSLSSIGDHAFSNCGGLTGELHLPNNLVLIGQMCFDGCVGIDKFVIENPNMRFPKLLFSSFLPIIICGYRHSTADKYAKENLLVFEEIL